MTKRTVSFGAILAVLALPLAVHAQPIDDRRRKEGDLLRSLFLRCRNSTLRTKSIAGRMFQCFT